MSPIRMERIESGVRAIISFTDAFNRRDLSAMLQLVSTDCIFEAASPPPDGAVHKGKTAIVQYWQGLFTRFPHAHMKIEESLGYGLRCISRWRMDTTDSSGNTTHLRGLDIFRFQNELITEHLSYIKG